MNKTRVRMVRGQLELQTSHPQLPNFQNSPKTPLSSFLHHHCGRPHLQGCYHHCLHHLIHLFPFIAIPIASHFAFDPFLLFRMSQRNTLGTHWNKAIHQTLDWVSRRHQYFDKVNVRDGTIDQAASSDDDNEPLRLGIFRGPNASGKTFYVPSLIQAVLAQEPEHCSKDTLVVHITSPRELYTLQALASQHSLIETGFQAHRDTYDGFIKIIRANLDLISSNNFLPGDRKQQWEESKILPPHVAFFIDEDPVQSAPFCLLVVELLSWAIKAIGCSDPVGPFTVSVVFLSSGGAEDTVKRFLDKVALHAGLKSPAPGFSIKRPRENGDHKIGVRDETFVSTVSGLFAPGLDPPTRLAVICFPPWDRVDGIEGPNKTLNLVDENLPNELLDTVFSSTVPEALPCLQVICLPHGFRALVKLQGFNRGVILLSPLIVQPIIDARSGRVLDHAQRVSVGHRLEQASWAHRFDVPATEVTVYTDQNELPLSDWQRRVRVDNDQMAGFLAALSGSPFNISVVAQIGMGAFISDFNAQFDRLKQLRQMGIFTVEEKLESLEFTHNPNLSGPVRDTFYAVLPILDYDPRLALFVALPCLDLTVTKVKLQLAALINLRLTKLPFGPKAQEMDPALFREMVAEECIGYTKPIAATGFMWAYLGLWKQAAVRSNNFSNEDETHVDVLDGAMRVSGYRSRLAIDLMSVLKDVLHSYQGVEVEPTDIGSESNTWADNSVEELQYHFMRCFAHSSIVASRLNDILRLHNLPKWHYFDMPSRWLAFQLPPLTYDRDAIAEMDQGPPQEHLLGICVHATGAPEGGISIHDWTWMPLKVLKMWTTEFADGEPLHEALKTICILGENADAWVPAGATLL